MAAKPAQNPTSIALAPAFSINEFTQNLEITFLKPAFLAPKFAQTHFFTIQSLAFFVIAPAQIIIFQVPFL